MTIRYSFDTSSFLNGRRDLLPPAVFRSLWVNVDVMIDEGQIRSVDVVRDELAKRDDEVAEWAKSCDSLFVSLDLDIQRASRRVLQEHPRLMGRGGGRNGADPFVIGLALARNATVVTEETLSGNLQRPRIPNVCEAMGIPWRNLVGFVSDQGWSW